jgi:tetratricopeptide (TPR) repeat protein
LWLLWQEGRQPDLRPFLAACGELSPAQLAAVAAVDQHERWQRGERVAAETYLQTFPSLASDPEAALELIYGEFLFREERGETPSCDEYVRRFPAHEARLRQQFALHQAMRPLTDQSGADPGTLVTGETPSKTLKFEGSASGPARTSGPDVPGYELLGELGRGAMGVVYRARQRSVNRLVALKLLPAAASADEEELARFRTEAEAVGRLQHPNIVSIYDVGGLDGLPYLALELVEGGTLAGRLDGTPWPPPRAAALVESLARAVHHVHRADLVHRDLKPSNVLLTAEGVPKITDFGLAKVLAGAAGTLTETGAILGTPSYMAPEQAEGQNRAVTTATDVWALGAILYELLAGRPPFKGQTALETLRLVQHAEPVAPRALNPAAPRDLETICLKCLQKAPPRRYGSAAVLADDLRRFQVGESILARPVGAGERLWRWCRRYPGVASLTAALALVVGGSLAGLTGLYLRAESERRRAEEAQENWRLAATRAQDAEARANDENRHTQREQQNAQKAVADTEAVLKFFLEHVLAAARPKGDAGGLGVDVTVRAALDAAAPKVDRAFAQRPAVEAYVRDVLGQTYYFLGEPELARRNLARALELRRRVWGPDHAYTLHAMNDLAQAYAAAGRPAEALPLFADVLQRRRANLGPDDPDTLISLNNLASAYQSARRPAEAVPLFEDVLKRRQSRLGPDHPDTLIAMNNLGCTYRDMGRPAAALSAFEGAFERGKARLAPDHPTALSLMNNLALAYQAAGRLAEALPLFEESLTRRRAKFGPDHLSTLTALNNLAGAYQAAGRLAEALPLYEQALERRRAKLGPDHPDTINTMDNLASAYRHAGRSGEALPLWRVSLEKRRRQLPAQHPDLAVTLASLASVLSDLDRPAEAEPLLRECLAIRERKLPAGDWPTAAARTLLGDCLAKQRKYDEAESLLLQGYQGLANAQGIPPSLLRETVERVVKLYEAWGKNDKSDEWRKKMTDGGTPRRSSDERPP